MLIVVARPDELWLQAQPLPQNNDTKNNDVYHRQREGQPDAPPRNQEIDQREYEQWASNYRPHGRRQTRQVERQQLQTQNNDFDNAE